MPSPVALRAPLRPSFIVLALVALSAAGCSSDTSRFESPFANPFASKPQLAAGDVTGSVNSAPRPGGIDSKPLPAPGQAAGTLPPPTGAGTMQGGIAAGGAAQPAMTGSVSPRYNQAAAATRTTSASESATHTVVAGETMIGIAKRYNVPLKELAKVNRIEPHAQVKMGDRLVIPGRTASTKPPALAAKPAPAPTQPQSKVAAVPATKVASTEPQHTARAVSPTADVEDTAKASTSGSPSFRWPVRGRIIVGFGPKPNGQQNDGINLSVPEGTPIKAAEDGVVAYAGNELKGYGNLVLIRHPNGFVTAYAHASELLVKRGDTIKRGQIIAKAGQTGTVSSPQVHFEIRKGSSPVDPTQYLNGA
jgi:murein DD-endopeptidase MepM/ murein hydrolase activator NlpD